ncbi:MAG: carbon-nitrogen hydrolase family protein [Dehalococcoidales bacterium]
MRIFALELNNDIKGIAERKEYIESLISGLPSPDIILLPEMAICSYMASQAAWQYADDCGKDTSAWAIKIAKRYRSYVGVGYIDYDKGDYFNRYLIAGEEQVYGVVTKNEGEAAVFKRGRFDNTIATPFGNVAVAICYDARRRNFYENIKDKKIAMIVFPHGSPANPQKDTEERMTNDYLCNTYVNTFGTPVIYVNSTGKLEYMPGIMGMLMKKAGFTMNGKSKIYANCGNSIASDIKQAIGFDTNISEQSRKKDIHFYGNDLIKGNFIFRNCVMKPDIIAGIRRYNKGINKKRI